jgi:cell division cycle 2-like protein
MASSTTKSRWANSEEDVALEARLKKEKEEKKRIKAEKAQKLEAERQARASAAAAATAHDVHAERDESNGPPPPKRRRLTPEPPAAQASGAAVSEAADTKLLRFTGGSWGRCRSVENYDKLNDIEEGAYGWVARAKELATGRVVALKRLKIDPKDRSGLPVTGLREIQILKDCNHRNVVKMLEVVVGEATERIEKCDCS